MLSRRPGAGRGAVRRWGTALAAALLVTGLAASCTVPHGASLPSTGVPTSTEIFSPHGPWNAAIPSHPLLDGRSDEMVSALTRDHHPTALIDEFGVPVYEADASTPKVSVSCTATDWGPCPLSAQPIPIPANAEPSPGEDGAMVVIDRSSGRVYDFWRAQRSGRRWTVSWGTWAAVGGDGIGGDAGRLLGGATGAGVNLLAGLVRLSEIRANRIPHALSFASRLSCPKVFRYPATKTDGAYSGDLTCVPQGARVQLDPSIDVAAIPDITPGEVAVARALQTYGAYLRDTAGSPMAFAFERPTDGDDPYPASGFAWDYYDMPHVPWDRLTVLAHWDGR